jgi:hypothetical protein
MATLASQLLAKSRYANDREEQLLKLFWNRAELKRQLDKLRKENFLLSEELAQERAIKLRLQQRFDQLEAMLANPSNASTAITYFQLRDAWNRCRYKLESVSYDLSKFHYDKELRLHVARFRRGIFKSVTGVQHELDAVNLTGEKLRFEIHALRERRHGYRGFWNFFRRRRITAEISAKRFAYRSVTARAEELTGEIEYTVNVEPPEFPGLDIGAKRLINLNVIACAQELYLLFDERDVAARAREASIMQVADVRYGDRRDCRALRHQVESCLDRLENDTKLNERVQARVDYLQTMVSYRRDIDTIPAAEALECITVFNDEAKQSGKLAVNVLSDEYWDLFPALLN